MKRLFVPLTLVSLSSLCNCVALVFSICCLHNDDASNGRSRRPAASLRLRNTAGALTMSRLPALTPTPAPSAPFQDDSKSR